MGKAEGRHHYGNGTNLVPAWTYPWRSDEPTHEPGVAATDVRPRQPRISDRLRVLAASDLDQRRASSRPRFVALLLPVTAEGQETISSLQGVGIFIDERACLYVDGVARPYATIGDFSVDDVESVEVYPRGSELSKNLAWRWPARMPCGSPNGIVAPKGALRAHEIVIWTRK